MSKIARISVLAFALVFAACETQSVWEKPSAEPIEDFVEYRINASCTDAKTVNDGMSTKWEKGDAIAAIYKSGGQTKSAKFINEGGSSFTGEVSIPDQPCDWYAFYPYSADIKNPAAVNVSIPATSVQKGYGSMAHLAGSSFPLYGKAAGISGEPDIPMSQIATVCRFKVTNGYAEPIVITGLTFTAPGAVCGSYSANMTGDSAELAAVSTATRATLTIDGGAELRNGETAELYLGMAPFAYNGEFSIRIDATCNGKPIYSEKTVITAMDFKSGTINNIPYKFKKTGDAAVRAYVKVTADPGQAGWAGTYMVVNTAGNKLFAPFAENAGSYAVDVTVKDDRIEYGTALDRYAVTISGGIDDHGNLSGKKAYDVMNSDGKYLFFSQGRLMIQDTRSNTEYTYRHAFGYDANGVQMISSGTSSGQNRYYHTFANGAFIYQQNQTANRVQLYRLVETDPDGPIDPPAETDLGTFNLESNALKQYLDATTSYTDSNWESVTVITRSPFSGMCGVGGEGYDFPTPVTVNWTGNNRQNVTVSIYSDSSRSADSLDQTASSTSTSVKFYNLIPNRKYYYTVALNDGTELDRGYFNTTGRRRQLKTTNTVSEDYATNVRDLGGMVTSDNKSLNYGLIYRGSNMSKIGNAEKAVIRDYMKVRLDVDLRQDNDFGTIAAPAFDTKEVAYSHVAYDGTSMTDFLNKSKVNKTFSDIISYVSQGKAVYIHCKSGADRTGYVCMLIEAVCGVSLADCTKDYEITSFSKAGSRDRCGQKNAYLFQEALKHVLAAEGSTFQQKAINTLKTDGGITDAQIKALQDAMIQK